MRFKILVGLSLFGFAVPVLAEPNAGSLLNQQEQQQRQIPQQLPAPEAPPERPPLKQGGAQVVVKSIRFSGATDLVPTAALNKVVAYAIGQKLDFAGLETLARHVTDYLHAQGWFLASAYLPQQDVSQGDIEIAIRAGHLDGANGKGSPFSIEASGETPLRLKISRLTDIGAPLLQPGAVADKAKVERALLLMQDLPGIAVQARLQPGANPDSTHITIGVKEGPLVSGSAWADNYGNFATGTNEANLSAELNDPAHIGDQLGGRVTRSDGLTLGQLDYSLPLGGRGVRLALSTNAMLYRVVNGLGTTTGLKGNSTTYTGTLTYPVIRTRLVNLYASGGYKRTRLQDTSFAGTLDDKRTAVWSASLSGSVLDTLGGGGLTSWGLTGNAGDIDLKHNAAGAAQDAAGYRTAGGYVTLDANLSRLQKLPGTFTLYAAVRAQRANKNLDSSAQFILGGPYGVRAYPGGEASGDEGWLANLDLRYDLPRATRLGQWRLTGFYDTGHIRLHHDTLGLPISTATGQNSYGLSGWGLGVELRKAGRYDVRLVWATKIDRNPGRSVQGNDVDNHDDRNRLWLQAAAQF